METDRLTTMLFPQGTEHDKLVNLKFFPGDDATSPAEFRSEVHKALHFVRVGVCEKRNSFGAEGKQVEIDDFLSVA